MSSEEEAYSLVLSTLKDVLISRKVYKLEFNRKEFIDDYVYKFVKAFYMDDQEERLHTDVNKLIDEIFGVEFK